MILIRIPELMGSAPDSGAVFRALAGNIVCIKIFEAACVHHQCTRGWAQGVSSHTRGGCAPQLQSSDFNLNDGVEMLKKRQIFP